MSACSRAPSSHWTAYVILAVTLSACDIAASRIALRIDSLSQFSVMATIGHASSDDLVTWSEQRELDVTRALDRPVNAWAPEAFYDKRSSTTLIFWASALGTPPWTKPTDIKRSSFGIYYVTTKDFVTFTDAKPLLPPPPLGPSVIDATMGPASNGAYYLVFKHEVNKTLAVASAKAVEGPYTTIAYE